jgi:hypothetical protein
MTRIVAALAWWQSCFSDGLVRLPVVRGLLHGINTGMCLNVTGSLCSALRLPMVLLVPIVSVEASVWPARRRWPATGYTAVPRTRSSSHSGKDADRDLPALLQARQEYARLQMGRVRYCRLSHFSLNCCAMKV